VIRKNQNRLTATEKRNFVNAVLALKRSGSYDDLVNTHLTFITNDSDFGPRIAHRCASFLPWHRRFMLDFERALQVVNPSVTLPYWDWTVDRTASSSLWGTDFMGGNGRSSDRKVMTGPFAYGTGNWTLNVLVDSRLYLCRAFGVIEASLPTGGQTQSVLAATPYDVAPWNSVSNAGFRNLMEGWIGPNLHNRVHDWVGGTMSTGASPNDPVFWLHHCFIDKMWADWQKAHPGVGYLPTGGTTDVVDIDEPMQPWDDTAPRDMLDHTLYYTYG
jgi:tyrosinase